MGDTAALRAEISQEREELGRTLDALTVKTQTTAQWLFLAAAAAAAVAIIIAVARSRRA